MAQSVGACGGSGQSGRAQRGGGVDATRRDFLGEGDVAGGTGAGGRRGGMKSRNIFGIGGCGGPRKEGVLGAGGGVERARI